MSTKKNQTKFEVKISKTQATLIDDLGKAIKEMQEKQSLVVRTLLAGDESLPAEAVVTRVEIDPPVIHLEVLDESNS